MALFRQCLQDLVDLRRKSHIQHAVRFVQHQDLDGDEVDRPVPHVIQQTARSRHYDLRVLAQPPDLRVHVGAAHDRRGKNAPGAAEFIDRLLSLNRQLASRGQDQRQRMALRRGRESLDHGNHERRRLAGTGLRTADDIPALKCRRDGARLNWGRFRKACLRQIA